MTQRVSTDDRSNKPELVPTEAPQPIVLRWEWRTFAPQLTLPGEWPAAPSPDGAAASDETYFVSLRSMHNVKLRQGRLELKRLRRVDPDGLELWDPVLTVILPATVAALGELWRVWQVAPPGLPDTLLTAADLVQKVVSRSPWLRSVRVSKQRVPLSLAPCNGERVTLLVDGERWESVAVESEDPAKVLAAVRRLGLERLPNTNYPRMLKDFLGARSAVPTSMQETI